ncbi:hypothetical protein LTR84_002009 [Exophiala bonariae]|uniref:Zn(2)-C6 fungal-type domain-containing protein n=1 Tax=Exophiala bonariae TaxID=1690606 RepID=A0AAV9NDN9_9EURO|nr:hypothetical protein LTR84_002009 [Exophiala bonariae]
MAGDRARRQNRSCDHCRASKRRCLVSSPRPDNTPVICANCARLGHECTFKFVQAQSARLSKKTSAQKTVSSDNGNWFLGPSIENDPIVPGNILEVGNDLPDLWPKATLDHEFDVFLGAMGFTPAADNPQVNPLSSHDFHMEVDSTPDKPLSTAGRILDNISTTSSQGALGRPLLLLNSSLTSGIIEESLVHIYNVVISGNSSRWMTSAITGKPPEDAPGNDLWLITTSDSARSSNLVDGVLDPQFLSGPASSDSAWRVSSRVPDAEATNGMTLLGAVRFLDHFGGLYGNRLDRFERNTADTALKDVLKVFTMQWLSARDGMSDEPPGASSSETEKRTPSTSAMSTLYHESWLQARAALGKARNVRSFRVFYATILFEATTAAEDSYTWDQQKSSFLDDAFNILHTLSPLLRKHTKTLGPCSRYSKALEKSLQFMEFFGYLRDTVSSLTGDRRCKLPDDFIAETSRPSMDDTESTLVAVDGCAFKQQDFLELLSTLRQLMRMKRTLIDINSSACGPAEELYRLLTPAIEAMESMDKIMKPLSDIPPERFDTLAAESKVQILTLGALWTLGLSSFTEVANLKSKVGTHLISTDLFRKLYSCQSTGILRLSQLMRRLQCQPTLEMFNLYHGLSADIPLTGYHFSIELMVAALRQSIERQINLHSNNSADFVGFGLSLIAEDQWRDSVDSLMKGLLMLDVTVGGSRAVQAASEKLVHSYGDVLSDCWSTDFDT